VERTESRQREEHREKRWPHREPEPRRDRRLDRRMQREGDRHRDDERVREPRCDVVPHAAHPMLLPLGRAGHTIEERRAGLAMEQRATERDQQQRDRPGGVVERATLVEHRVEHEQTCGRGEHAAGELHEQAEARQPVVSRHAGLRTVRHLPWILRGFRYFEADL
jgi:hypothetical protein